MKYLKPLEIKSKLEKEEAKNLLSILEKIFLNDIKKIITEAQIENSKENDNKIILEAFKKGQLSFDGVNLKKQTKKLPVKVIGALFRQGASSKGGYVLEASPELLSKIQGTITQANELKGKVFGVIDNIQAEIDVWKNGGEFPTKIADAFEEADFRIYDLVADLESQTETLQTIDPMEVEAFKNDVVPKYIADLQKSITNFTQEATEKLRTDIVSAFESGIRYESLVKPIEKSFEISKNKAEFLARNEMGLVVADYTKAKYQSAGVNYYQWVSSQDQRVREWHDELNGKIFSYDNPPIIDLATKDRGNPKQTYNCRCRARPIVLNDDEMLIERTMQEGIIYYVIQKKPS